ncbi:hypothetical protein M9Y10_034706 [Tritrichomonas musculus]|uniref:Protein kinase domain-containing protein n=1 Tax=Tritrichomonas musculus TaxID=1915356 RepID=A0ABR2KFQ0_9EUKA
MGKIEEIVQRINQIIQVASSAYVYTEQCNCVVTTLKEILEKVQKLSDNSNEEGLGTLLTQLNSLHSVVDGFDSNKWSQSCLSTPVIKPISDLNEVMDSINETLTKLNISLEQDYQVVTEKTVLDLKGLYGIFADPSRDNDSKVKKKLEEIEKYLDSIGQPLLDQKKTKRHKKHHHDHHKKDKKKKSEKTSEQDSNETSSASQNDVDFQDFDNVQKYKLKKSDYDQCTKELRSTSRYVTYKGKMKKTQEDVTIMVLKDVPDLEEKFKRLVNVLTAVQHPNLESFVGSVESPLPYVVVTKRVGEKLTDVLERTKKKSRKSSGKNKEKNTGGEEDEKDEYVKEKHVTLKPGYRTIIAFNIATAMAYLHSLNIIHRDLCGSNITIDKAYNPRIINFANSRFLPNDTSQMSFKPDSSTCFRAPELTDMETYDETVDVFAFGGLLYELLMGSPPFGKLRPIECENKIRAAERPPLPQELSPELKDLITSCWAQDPKDRPSFADVVDTMLSKKISFPLDENTEIVEQFYAAKSIKNADLKACLDLFRLIGEAINSSFAYMRESIRIRSLLHGYQFLLQTSNFATQDELDDTNVLTQLSNLRRSLEALYETLTRTEAEKWSGIALSTSAIEIPTDLHRFMEQIYIEMTELGFTVTKYDYVDCDLIRDFRDAYSIFSEYAEQYQQAVQRMQEIESFLQERGLEITVTQNEIDERIKGLFTQFKDFRLNRDDFQLGGRPIGVGMSALVYKAKQISTGKDVAIKEFKEEYLEDDDAMFLLRREVVSLVKLNHEYLVSFIGFNDDPGKPLWVVSQIVKNGELFNAIKRKKLSPFQKTKIAFEIAEGMEYLHSKRVIHRDLKTGNVLLDGDTPKITDFGYARTNLSLVMTSKVGTVNYMAPEVILGNNYSFSADVFSYGMMLWELYSGDFPFSWVPRARVTDEIIDDTPLPYKMPIAKELKKLIEDCKCIDPEKRPSFSDIIERMLDEQIAYNGTNPAEVKEFYEKKAEKRAEMLQNQPQNTQNLCMSTILTF